MSDPNKVLRRVLEKFDKPEDPSDCWEWTGRVSEDGYGQYRANRVVPSLGTHRLSYIYHVGLIPDGLLVRHTCDNPPCGNPDHLVLGTQADNMADMVRRGRYRKGRTYHGADHVNAALSWDEVVCCREAYATGVFTYKLLAEAFGVSVMTIQRLVKETRYQKAKSQTLAIRASLTIKEAA